jgi:predicted Zn finger-like uncharacterized protein
MTVRCPSCNTRYRLPPRSRLGRNPTYRCTRCRHVFSPDEEAEAPAVEEDDPIAALDDDGDDTPAFTIEPSPPLLDDALDDEDDDARSPARRRTPRDSAPPAEPSSPARFALYLTIAVVLGYGLASIYFVTHPAEARALFARIPFIGDEMSETHLNAGNIQLTDVRGEYKRVPGDRLVFVISGTAINNAPVPVAGVQIQGRIIGPQEQRQVVYCGAVPENVTDLSVHEIDLLQTLKPSSDWLLRPGEQDRFLVAFVDPVQPLSEFAAEVVSVRSAAGRVESPLAKH